ncbi:unnamed protein product [Peniophora sp. CBMAI 1063]|nr:unnamed protein product [Peniophora sp. CBMAI 1063]
MINVAPSFISDNADDADVKGVATEHVDWHFAKVIGAAHVEIKDSMFSKYPALIAELLSRIWSGRGLVETTGGNLLPVLAGTRHVAAQMQREGVPPASEIHDKPSAKLPMHDGEL